MDIAFEEALRAGLSLGIGAWLVHSAKASPHPHVAMVRLMCGTVLIALGAWR